MYNSGWAICKSVKWKFTQTVSRNMNDLQKKKRKTLTKTVGSWQLPNRVGQFQRASNLPLNEVLINQINLAKNSLRFALALDTSFVRFLFFFYSSTNPQKNWCDMQINDDDELRVLASWALDNWCSSIYSLISAM